MKEKLQTIYEFLINNRKYNYDLQAKYYKSVVTYHNNIQDKVISLLYRIANSQSQPKIDNLAKFYQFIHEDIESLNSFSKFVKRVGGKESCYYKDLFEGLKGCAGWGQKTSALFIKSVFHMHNEKYDSSFRIWEDAPQSLNINDRLYIPVDAVIIEIFKRIGFDRCNFDTINKEVAKYYHGEAIEVWDDLWFWGFITQRRSGNRRILGWNPNKYWSLENSNKDETIIPEIKEKAEHFLILIS